VKQGVAYELLNRYRMEVVIYAVLLQENQGGASVRELAERIGVSKSTVHRWLMKARDRARNPQVELFDPRDGRPFQEGKDCAHDEKFRLGNRKVCLRCLISNFEGTPILERACLPVAGATETKKATPKFKPRGSPKSRVIA
jgi:DNA-binding transcriptional ArsR family regulator